MNMFWDQEVPYIPLLGFHHNLYMILMLFLLILLITNHIFIKDNQNKVHKILLVISMIQQIGLYSWYIFETGFELGESLPFHISRVSSILGIVFLITQNKKVLNVLFYFGLYAYGSFFYPSLVYPAYHLMGLSFFINHAITILLPILVAIISDWRPSKDGVIYAYRWFLIYFTFVYFFNPLVDGNYFYLKYRPFFDSWPDSIYIPFILVFTFIIFIVGYLGAKGIDLIVQKTNEKVSSKKSERI